MVKPVLDLVNLRILNRTVVEMGVVANGADAAQFPKRNMGMRDQEAISPNLAGRSPGRSDSELPTVSRTGIGPSDRNRLLKREIVCDRHWVSRRLFDADVPIRSRCQNSAGSATIIWQTGRVFCVVVFLAFVDDALI